MTLADDAMKVAFEQAGTPGPDEHEPQQTEAKPPTQTEPGRKWFQWLLSETGPGDYDAYLDDPLNIPKTEWGAQIARGVAGLTGHARLAILDILIGGIRGWLSTRKG